ncbi:flagellar protein FlgN [Paenibacillus sp. MBLB4367]|uniref:flagellar protein FlgN n=1 Tax=Paenibacillus sp. MBLB4367 TaxID=3384767 RepID=UPI003908204B
MIEPILTILSQLTAVHEQLLELGEQKTGVIVRNDVVELNRIVGKESRLTAQITALDQQRVSAVGQYLSAKGYRPHPYITVSDIVKLVVKMEEKQAIYEAQRKLLATIEQLKEVNKQNQQLIEQSLSYIDYSLDLLVGPPDDEATYQHPSNQYAGMKRSGLFDTRA